MITFTQTHSLGSDWNPRKYSIDAMLPKSSTLVCTPSTFSVLPVFLLYTRLQRLCDRLIHESYTSWQNARHEHKTYRKLSMKQLMANGRICVMSNQMRYQSLFRLQYQWATVSLSNLASMRDPAKPGKRMTGFRASLMDPMLLLRFLLSPLATLADRTHGDARKQRKKMVLNSSMI